MTETAPVTIQANVMMPHKPERDVVASNPHPDEGKKDEVIALEAQLRQLRTSLTRAEMKRDEAIAQASRDRHRMELANNRMHDLSRENNKLANEVAYVRNELRIYKAWCECDSEMKANNRTKRAANITKKEARKIQDQARKEERAKEAATTQKLVKLDELIAKLGLE